LWVLREACRRAASWPEHLGIAVNVSPVQLRRAGFCQAVIDTIRDTGITPARLELELTEGILMKDTREVLAILQRLRNLGVKLAMDDFGTGYSSLGYLQKFRFDKIKIDRSFISRLGEDPNADAIMRAVVSMTEALGIRAIAEGVETSAQADVLRAHGCAEAQGYLYSRPIPGEAFDALVTSGAAPLTTPTSMDPCIDLTISKVAKGLAPNGFAPSGLAPSGLAPSGLAPSGLAPSGLAPSGLAQSPLRVLGI
jgi:EAL domain-containing protein (putative c-di-GMP-specific phosphodiesterase class I)